EDKMSSPRADGTSATRFHTRSKSLTEYLRELADKLPAADISDAGLTIEDERGKEHRWGGINLKGQSADSLYKLKISRQIDRYYDWQTLTGEINPQDLQAQWRLEMSHNFTDGELAAIRKRLNVPLIQSGEGPTMIDISVEGPLDDTAKWSASGEVDLKSWTLRCERGLNLENMFLLVRFVPGRADVKLVEAKVFEGTVKGNFYVLADAGSDVLYGGTVAVDGASMDKLVAALAPNSDVDKGRLNASASFSCEGSKLENLRLRCAAIVENVDLLNVPVLPALLSVLGVPGAQGLNQSDLAAVIKMDGAIITVEQASMANALVAIQAEPGGTIDVANQRVDMFVVGAPLNQLTNALEQVPIINLFVDISKSVINKLTRLRVSGQWDEPSSKLVHVEPLGNAAAGTVQFFRSVLKAGGDLGRDVLKPFNDSKDSMTPKEQE
ncbi:MAG: hypothetical protein EHM48_03330, partial [Planctomycetaceae bacterium]